MVSSKKENKAMKDISRETGFTHVSQIQFEQENADMHDAMEDQFSYAMRLYEDRGATYDTIVGFRHKLAFGLVSAVSLIFEDANRLVAFVRTDADTALRDKMLDMLNHLAVALVLLDERLDQARLEEVVAPEQLLASAAEQLAVIKEQLALDQADLVSDFVEDEEPLPVEPEDGDPERELLARPEPEPPTVVPSRGRRLFRKRS